MPLVNCPSAASTAAAITDPDVVNGANRTHRGSKRSSSSSSVVPGHAVVVLALRRLGTVQQGHPEVAGLGERQPVEREALVLVLRRAGRPDLDLRQAEELVDRRRRQLDGPDPVQLGGEDAAAEQTRAGARSAWP